MKWTEERPWGRFCNLLDTDDYKVKLIEIDPDKRLSYQSHTKRSETLTAIRGSLGVILDEEKKTLQPGESLFVPQGSKHRYFNATAEKVQLIEVQTGAYFGEDDIIRYDDDFGRLQGETS